MTARVHDQAGFTLVEMLTAMTLFVVVTLATLGTFDQFNGNNRRLVAQNDATDKARSGVDRIARDLRNHATPTTAMPDAIERAQPTDVILLTVGAARPAGSANMRNLRRVRYCVSTDQRRLWMQTQTWTTAGAPAPGTAPAGTACPGPVGPENTHAWTSRVALAEDIVNPTAFTFAPATYASTGEIRAVNIALHVDANPAVAPAASQLATTVALRNQNRPPVAGFAARAMGNRHVQLTSTTSADPEGHDLEYRWFAGTVDLTAGQFPKCPRAPTCDLETTAGAHEFRLTVTDPSDLSATSPPLTVVVS